MFQLLGFQSRLFTQVLTKCSRGIRNAWHLHYALSFVFKVVAATSVLRRSPLNMALCRFRDSEVKLSDSLINNIDKLSEPVTKLIEVTSAGIGKLYHPLGIVRQAKADAKAKIIIAKADAEIAELNKRANERVEHREMLRQNNIENVVSIAANEMPTEVSENPVDVDWTLQFFDAAQDVCDNDMQLLL
ncbi:TPA: DUF2806 domain-containing protein [Vibrio vulnificus]|nr:DUF2806 domain-containing protein [Vibrio vulnificus]